MLPRYRIGTSGYSYAHWGGGVFYPPELPSSRWLGYYAAQFPTVELNNPFYRLPSRQTFEHWRQQVPAGFQFAVKASRYITHRKKLLDPAPSLALLSERVEGLGEKLGPVLFQLPPKFRLNQSRLTVWLAALPRGWRTVIEFRDPSWFVPAVYRQLERPGVALCWAVSPAAPEPAPVHTASFLYLRMHGGRAERGRFSDAELRRWAKRLEHDDSRDIFVYFNNDWEGFAIANAQSLRNHLEATGRRRAA